MINKSSKHITLKKNDYQEINKIQNIQEIIEIPLYSKRKFKYDADSISKHLISILGLDPFESLKKINEKTFDMKLYCFGFTYRIRLLSSETYEIEATITCPVCDSDDILYLFNDDKQTEHEPLSECIKCQNKFLL